MHLSQLSLVVYSFQRKSNRGVTLMWLNGFHDLNNLISLWKWPSPGKSTVLCGRWVALGGEWVKGEEIANCKINSFHVSSQSCWHLMFFPKGSSPLSIQLEGLPRWSHELWLLSPERGPHILDRLIFIRCQSYSMEKE